MIPRVSFIVWKASHERLNTGDRLSLFDLTSTLISPFCQYPDESHSHLFFNCLFSTRIWNALKAKCNVNWPDVINFVTKETKGKSLRSIIFKLSLLCSVYHIWLERNNRIFNKEYKPEEVVIKSTIQMIRGRLCLLKFAKINRWWLVHCLVESAWVCFEAPYHQEWEGFWVIGVQYKRDEWRKAKKCVFLIVC